MSDLYISHACRGPGVILAGAARRRQNLSSGASYAVCALLKMRLLCTLKCLAPLIKREPAAARMRLSSPCAAQRMKVNLAAVRTSSGDDGESISRADLRELSLPLDNRFDAVDKELREVKQKTNAVLLNVSSLVTSFQLDGSRELVCTLDEPESICSFHETVSHVPKCL